MNGPDQPGPDRAGPDRSGLDWPGLMRAGLYGLRLQPREFWALTPAELALMLGRDGAVGPISRARLLDLERQWPDQPKQPQGDEDGTGKL